MNKYKIGQKLEVHGLGEGMSFNGEIVVVKALPGYNAECPSAYGVLFKDGALRAAVDRYLRPFPPKLPNERGDTDKVVSWADCAWKPSPDWLEKYHNPPKDY